MLGVLGYSIVRLALVWHLMSRHHVNPVLFAAIDIGTAIPYAHGWARLIQSAAARRLDRVVGWSSVVALTFAAPYAYVAAAADQLPAQLCLILAGFLGLSAGSALTRKMRRSR